VLSNVESIQEKLESVNQLLSEEQIGVLTNLREVKNTMQKLALISANYKDLSERVNSALIELDDVATEVEGFQTELDVNPKRLEEVEGKLSAINNLMQKHIVQTIPELIEIREQLTQKVEATENVDKDILNKEKEIKAVVKQLDSEVAIITKKRNDAIPKLITQLEDILSQLGMPNAQFKITLNKSEIFLFNGKDELEFLFSANKGGQFNTLKKSGFWRRVIKNYVSHKVNTFKIHKITKYYF